MQIAESAERAEYAAFKGTGALEVEKTAAVDGGAWLFSRNIDLAVFLGSAVLSLLLIAAGWWFGLLDKESPEWVWVGAVLLIDVAHVWATSFRVYFDIAEFRRRFWLYLLVPVLGYAVGAALYSEGEFIFWRALAFAAIFHFVRQQYGWVALYRRKRGETGIWSWRIDAAAVYLAAVYPLIFWMANLPRDFHWFIRGDFIQLPAFFDDMLFPIYAAVLAAYFFKSAYQYFTAGFLNLGKDIVVATTAICWYIGIVLFNSDFAFTVTNVIIHGVPYFALIHFYAKARAGSDAASAGGGGMASRPTGAIYRAFSSNWIVFLASLWALAYVEELFWHRGVWHERNWLFGENWDWGGWQPVLVPLLAVPQLTHYILDGFIWRRKQNPGLPLR